MKVISCGVIVTDTRFILGCLPTNHNLYDIPKGHNEEGESFFDTALRELQEETGIDAKGQVMIDLGIFSYNSHKNLYLYLYKMDRLPPVNTLKCSSYFRQNGRNIPEMNGYKHIPLHRLDMFSPHLSIVLLEALADYL